MMKFMLIALTFGLGYFGVHSDIGMMGLHVNDPEAALDKIKLEVTSNDQSDTSRIVQYKTENGNELTIMTDHGKIKYFANKWEPETDASNKCVVSNFVFGKTTVSEMRKQFGTEGYTFKTRKFLKTPEELLVFNVYDLDSPGKEVLVTLSKASLKDGLTKDNMYDLAKLNVLIISDPSFIDQLWMDERNPNTDNVKVKL